MISSVLYVLPFMSIPPLRLRNTHISDGSNPGGHATGTEQLVMTSNALSAILLRIVTSSKMLVADWTTAHFSMVRLQTHLGP